VIYQGIRLTPAEIVAAAVQEGVDLVGLSVLSGSHLQAVADVLAGLRKAGVDVPVVVGGIIPPADAEKLRQDGVARVFTPKDFALTGIIDDLVTVVREANDLPPRVTVT
jgi:(2R)-ethylmalonyl-CoA mutase